LDYAADNLTNIRQNTMASRSRIVDADYAAESAEIARTLIIQRAASAMLAQANVQPALVVSLLGCPKNFFDWTQRWSQ
jgi:flagellin